MIDNQVILIRPCFTAVIIKPTVGDNLSYTPSRKLAFDLQAGTHSSLSSFSTFAISCLAMSILTGVALTKKGNTEGGIFSNFFVSITGALNPNNSA